MKLVRSLIVFGLATLLLACSDSPQQSDPDFRPKDRVAHFSSDSGPLVLIDEAHNNFLTMSGRYKPFAQVLESDRFKVSSNDKAITENLLRQVDILVIANALDRKRQDWLPPYGEALNDHEVEALKSWILNGGSLFLVADHTPFPKTIENLALALGFQFINGLLDKRWSDGLLNIILTAIKMEFSSTRTRPQTHRGTPCQCRSAYCELLV